jgi:hypothetical protein
MSNPLEQILQKDAGAHETADKKPWTGWTEADNRAWTTAQKHNHNQAGKQQLHHLQIIGNENCQDQGTSPPQAHQRR